MSWHRKQRGRATGYYYRSVRVDGRAVKEYVGTGPKAVEEARRVADRQAARRQMREQDVRIESAELLLTELKNWVGLLARVQLITGGYYDHHGAWRRRQRQGGCEAATTPEATRRQS